MRLRWPSVAGAAVEALPNMVPGSDGRKKGTTLPLTLFFPLCSFFSSSFHSFNTIH